MYKTSTITRYVFFVLAILLLLLNISGCENDLISPYKTNTHWLSTDPYLSIKADVDPFIRNWAHSSQGVLVWNEENLTVAVSFDTETFTVSSQQNECLFRGSWNYEDNTNLVLHIEEDFLMENEYETIVLQPIGVDIQTPEDFDETYPYELCHSWYRSDSPSMIIHQQEVDGVWVGAPDILFWNNGAISISTVMIGNRYYAVNFSSEYKDLPEILFSGTWEYISGNLVLYVEQDHLMGEQYETIVLVAQR